MDESVPTIFVYTLFHRDGDKSVGIHGGVCIYLREFISSFEVLVESDSNKEEGQL